MVAQVQIINKILDTKDFSPITSNNISEDYFFDTKNEFNFIKNHYDLYKIIPDKLTFRATFPEFVIDQVNEPYSYLLEQLYNEFNTAYLAKRFNTIKTMLESDKTEEAVKYFTNSLEGLHTGAVMTCTDLLEDTSRYDRYLERTTDHEKYYLTTGFEDLDAITGGIDRKNENMVIIARPGQGKTQILLKMAATASQQGLRVGIFEGEMTTDKVGYRIDTFLNNISNTALNRGYLEVNAQYKRYIDTLKSRNWGPIKVLTLNDIPTGICTVDTLKSFVEKENLDILFVDQYDLMDDLHKTQAEHEHIAHIAKDIKKLQVEKQIPIISVCQMNRTKNEDKDGNKYQDTTQVAGSDKIARYATTIIALDQKLVEDSFGKYLELALNIVKARDGGNGNKVLYKTDFNTGRFDLIPSETSSTYSAEDRRKIKESYEMEIPEEY